MSPPVGINLPGLTMSVQPPADAPPQVCIYFGSQSGTAECFAEDLPNEAAKHGITTEVLDFRSFSPEVFASKKIVILIVATYGDGEPTDNAVDFFRWSANPANDGILSGQRFCVMGLGDMNYTRFCQMGKDTDFYMERLGAKRIYSMGIGDDCQDIEDDFQRWKDGGLWESLKTAIKEVEAEGGFLEMAKAAAKLKAANQTDKLPLYLFIGAEEKDGTAQDVSDALLDKLKERGLGDVTTQQLSDRKACDVVKRMPKNGFAMVVVDSTCEGLCSAGKKLVRNMTVELDKQVLKEKGIRFAVMTVTASTGSSTAASMRQNQIEQNSAPVKKAFAKAGCYLVSKVPSFFDAGFHDPMPVLDEVCDAIVKASNEPLPSDDDKAAKGQSILTRNLGPDASLQKTPEPQAGARTVFLCTGNEAKEAAQAITKSMRSRCSVEDAALVSMAGAARQQTQVVLVVDCSVDGLSDGARGLSSQLSTAPAAMLKQLGKLKFALLTVVCSGVGNAQAEYAKAVDPVAQSLAKSGANCVATSRIDLSDANDNTIMDLCQTIKGGFGMLEKARVNSPAAAPTPIRAAAAAAFNNAAPDIAPGATEVRLANSITALPEEVAGEPADVVSRFYFEAEECSVLKMRQLRQEPKPDEGLSTIEVEVEASGKLTDYSVGGTFSVLPENCIEDVHGVLPLLGMEPNDLKKSLTFVVGPGTKLKRPFPTPCTLAKALTCYCDLARPPTKKMLSALQPRLKDPEAKDRVAALLKDEDAMKSLQSSSICCRMHEFWALLGVTSLDISDFLLNCPRMKPREFTIASSPKASPNKISLCVSLTSHSQSSLGSLFKMLQEKGLTSPSIAEPSRGQQFFGLCSSWLNARLKVGDKVLAKQRPSPLKLPEKDVPVIMVGAGAGLAPFRGFWEELRKGSQSSPAMLFFGCRHPDKDWLYKEEMSSAVKLGAACGALARMQVGPKRPLNGLYTAFSRPDVETDKKYVQDDIRAQAGMVKMAMENDGSVFICGSTAMGYAVLETLGEIIEGGAAQVEVLRKQHRIVAEMWG